VLIISPYFPPINTPDLQRVRMSLPYYRANGWEPVVLAVRPDLQGGVVEPELAATVPADVRVVHAGAWPIRLSRALGVGTLGWRAWAGLLWRGTALLRREKFDLVFFSTTQFVTFTLGPIWRRWFGVPYVLDFQDPWRTGAYERPGAGAPPGGWKYQVARLVAWALERGCVRSAAGAMSVSPGYLEELRHRYPAFRSVPAEVIRFGASRGDLAAAAALPPSTATFPREAGQIHLLNTGASGPILPEAATALFEALRQYRELQPARCARLRLHFIGTSYAAEGRGVPTVLPVAVRCGVADLVREVPHRIGLLAAMRLQLDTDALLLLGSRELAYSPSKLYPYYLAQRPMLALVFADSVLARLLDELACASVVPIDASAGPADAVRSIHGFFDQLCAGSAPDPLPRRDERAFDARFLADELTRQQCRLFDRAVALPGPGAAGAVMKEGSPPPGAAG
jgi:hypothetical protein